MTGQSDSERKKGQEIYKRLNNAWQAASIDREARWKELVLAPIFDGFAPIGAAIFLAVLCYPENPEKRSKVMDALSARVIKDATLPKSRERRDLRATPGMNRLIDLPNKRIDQILEASVRRLHTRLRAGWVLSQKMVSSECPAAQLPLRDPILVAAKTNTRAYPAFFSEDNDEDQLVNSFRQRVMLPTRPVAHLALGLHDELSNRSSNKVRLFELVLSAESWLSRVIENSEKYRVSFGDLFPSSESSRYPTRQKNYYVPPGKMIAVLPYIDPISSETDFEALKSLERT